MAAPPEASNVVQPVVEQDFERCSDLRRWRFEHAGALPRRNSDDSTENSLANWLSMVLPRRLRAVGPKPSQRKLTAEQTAHLDELLGFCSGAQGSERPSASLAGGQAAISSSSTSFEDCQEILENQLEHIAALKSMLPDVETRPSDSRIRELAECLKVPKQVDRHTLPLDLVFRNVQQQFRDEVGKLQSTCRTMSSTNPAAKKARVATAVAGSGGPHSAAPSNRVDEVESSSSGVAQSAVAKQLPSHAGRVLNTGSSDVAQLIGTCQEPRSTMVYMKILDPIWAIEVADGQKMFECVANKTKWHNQFKQLASGDCIIIVMKSRDKISAVCEVASPATVKETNRDVLKCKLQESRHEALDAYLDGAESFDYVEFKHVYDCRRSPPVSSTAAFLEQVGLALPKTPLVGLLRPVVLDEQWHSRLHEYMQQAVLRLPVSLATASDKALVAASNVDGHATRAVTMEESFEEVLEVIPIDKSRYDAIWWLVLEESRFDAIASGRLRWEARPRGAEDCPWTRPLDDRLRDPYFDWVIAERGRSVVLQREMGTCTYRKHAKTLAVKIAQVRIFSSAWHMLEFLAADLLPNCTNPIKFYLDKYGAEAANHAFVAMRFEEPDMPQISSVGSHQSTS